MCVNRHYAFKYGIPGTSNLCMVHFSRKHLQYVNIFIRHDYYLHRCANVTVTCFEMV